MGRQLLRFVVAVMAVMYATTAMAATCKQYSSCRQAVVNWCAGNHPRADGDGDGIPCENVCRSLAEVEAIKREIGCRR